MIPLKDMDTFTITEENVEDCVDEFHEEFGKDYTGVIRLINKTDPHSLICIATDHQSIDFGDLPTNTVIYFQNGIPHREDGPAIEYKGRKKYLKIWMFKGTVHRLIEPAIEAKEFSAESNLEEIGKSWWHAGMLHRLDGPSKMLFDGFHDFRENSYCLFNFEMPNKTFYKKCISAMSNLKKRFDIMNNVGIHVLEEDEHFLWHKVLTKDGKITFMDEDIFCEIYNFLSKKNKK